MALIRFSLLPTNPAIMTRGFGPCETLAKVEMVGGTIEAQQTVNYFALMTRRRQRGLLLRSLPLTVLQLPGIYANTRLSKIHDIHNESHTNVATVGGIVIITVETKQATWQKWSLCINSTEVHEEIRLARGIPCCWNCAFTKGVKAGTRELPAERTPLAHDLINLKFSTSRFLVEVRPILQVNQSPVPSLALIASSERRTFKELEVSPLLPLPPAYHKRDSTFQQAARVPGITQLLDLYPQPRRSSMSSNSPTSSCCKCYGAFSSSTAEDGLLRTEVLDQDQVPVLEEERPYAANTPDQVRVFEAICGAKEAKLAV
ncbi:hypothetical protein GALMADRAFT_133868 [Galerina marginata CBS 339.88]|uniref:Uncharacterized protein n=1 Tax=Galerina marginata (strain CBS 339.88) TaxID=685588 RepID=A0A067TN70_GALM3|nr:hypothetical protein GALMADRAFT_133868 [Galerina marginata CBS 339.88]